MSEFEWDPSVDRLLKDVANTVAGYLDPPGADGVYATVRQRRRSRAVAVGVLALALLGGPTVGLALAGADDSGPPVGGGPSATASEAVPSPSESASPSPSSSTSATPAAPDGRITLADLMRARLDLPPWPATVPECEHSKVEFVGEPAYTDVDHDGAQETVAWLRCQPTAEYKVSKVMAFDRDAAGSIVTTGQVLETPSGGDEGVGMWKVWAIQAAPDGHIRIDVGDYWPCCGTPTDIAQHQWRTYGWDGRKFVQTGGPTKFGPNRKFTDLAITADDLMMTQQADGTWRGTLTVKVRNAGPSPARIAVSIRGTELDGIGSGWDKCEGAPVATEKWVNTDCDGGVLAVGKTQTLSVTFSSHARPSGTFTVTAYHHDGSGVMGGSVGGSYPDLNPDDNSARVTIKTG